MRGLVVEMGAFARHVMSYISMDGWMDGHKPTLIFDVCDPLKLKEGEASPEPQSVHRDRGGDSFLTGISPRQA